MDTTSHFEDPPLCANGCGFFGNPANSGLCSKCYCVSLKKEETATSASSSATAGEIGEVGAAPAGGSGSSSRPMAGQEALHVVQRCGNCAKRLKLLSRFICRCEGAFCTAHRLPETRARNFDFKTRGRAAITEANPVVMESKLERLGRGEEKIAGFLVSI